MTDRELMQQALELEALIDAARLLGVTQAKRGFGCYTQEDARFEQAMHEAVQRHRTALRERLARPSREWVGLTDEERNNLWRDVIGWGDPSHDDEDLMKAIEAKLREKNGA